MADDPTEMSPAWVMNVYHMTQLMCTLQFTSEENARAELGRLEMASQSTEVPERVMLIDETGYSVSIPACAATCTVFNLYDAARRDAHIDAIERDRKAKVGSPVFGFAGEAQSDGG